MRSRSESARPIRTVPTSTPSTRSVVDKVILCGGCACDLMGQKRLVGGSARDDDAFEFAVHHVSEFLEREVDAVIGKAVLREVICADTFGAIAQSDLLAT